MRPFALTAGLVTLSGFLAALVVVFVQEDETRASESLGQRQALEAFASVSVQRALEAQWQHGVDALERALGDALVDDSSLLWVSDGVQRLPRYAGGTLEGIARKALGPVPVVDSEAPSATRHRLLSTLERALTANDKPGIEAAVRAFLEHRRNFRLDVADDLSTMVTLVELLQTRSSPSPVLLEGALREGFGEGVSGLQRAVLDAARKLTPAELLALCEVVARQSRKAGLPAEDFTRRCADVSRAAPVELERSASLSLRAGWLVRGLDEVRGVKVSATAALLSHEQSMLELGLLEPGDRLRLTSNEGPLQTLAVQVEAARWERAASSRRLALSVKLSLLVLAFGLGVGLVLAFSALQRREAVLVRARAELVATVSHELRTPLASLRVMAETLERKLEHAPEAKQWPARIVAEVDGLSVLVENILSFNRLDQRRDLLRLTPWSAESLEGWLREDAVGLEVTVTGAAGVTVLADPVWLRLAFANLARNALKYVERTPATLRVTITKELNVVAFELEDNGVGIAPEAWSEVFEAFHRLREGGARGSGLGLAIVKKVAEGHGGSVRVVASSAAGTRFRLELPLSMKLAAS